MDPEHEVHQSEGAQKGAQRHFEDEQRIVAPEIRQHSAAPISKLPNEILLQIFAIYKTGFPIRSWEDVPPLRLWHRVAHVCQHWRQVALNDASLWTGPPTQLHNYTLLMLKRSRQSQLSVHLHSGISTATVNAVLEHLQRVDCLILDLYKEELDEPQQTLLGLGYQSFSQLRELHIIGKGDLWEGIFELSASTFRYASSLKQLRLKEIDFDWQLFPISSLTSLHLDRVRVSVSPSWKQFQDILRRMPLLECLTFGFNDLRIYSPPSHLEPLELSSLRKLELRSSHHSVTQAFIYSTTLSQQLRRASFVCWFNTPDVPHGYSPIVHAVLSLHEMCNLGPFKKVFISGNQLWISPKEEDEDNPADTQGLLLLIYWNHQIDDAREGVRFATNIMTEIGALRLPRCPASDIMHLSLTVDLSPLELLTLFGNLPNLETITTPGYNPSLQIVKSLDISPLHPPGRPVPFAKLNAIILNKYRAGGGDFQALLEELCDCLIMRYEYGAPVGYVFFGWELGTKEAQHLREIVVDVDVRVKRNEF